MIFIDHDLCSNVHQKIKVNDVQIKTMVNCVQWMIN
jgi:hypothetical protein